MLVVGCYLIPPQQILFKLIQFWFVSSVIIFFMIAVYKEEIWVHVLCVEERFDNFYEYF